MKAGRVGRILLKIAAALVAGFVISVGVAWGPLIAQEGIPYSVRTRMGDLAQEMRRRTLIHLLPSRDDPASKSVEADQAAVGTMRRGTLVVAWPMIGDDARDARETVGNPRTADWWFEFADRADDPKFWNRQSSWITRGSVKDGNHADYGAGWPWVVFSARGEPLLNSEDEDLSRRGWLTFGPPSVNTYGRAVPVRLYLRGAILGSVFYGGVLFAVAAGVTGVRRWRRARGGRCLACGYDLTGNLKGGCPECGRGK